MIEAEFPEKWGGPPQILNLSQPAVSQAVIPPAPIIYGLNNAY